MRSTFTLYVVDEKDLPTALHGSDQEKYAALVEAIKTHGGRWGELEMDVPAFAAALKTIDAQFGSTGFLPVFTFNNSPHKIMGYNSDSPSLGYFNPEQARDLYVLLKRIAPESFASQPDVEGVYHEFVIAAEHAARHGTALAVIHV